MSSTPVHKSLEGVRNGVGVLVVVPQEVARGVEKDKQNTGEDDKGKADGEIAEVEDGQEHNSEDRKAENFVDHTEHASGLRSQLEEVSVVVDLLLVGSGGVHCVTP